MSKQDLVVGHGASRPLSSAEFAHETANGAVRKLDAAIRADERRRVLQKLREGALGKVAPIIYSIDLDGDGPSESLAIRKAEEIISALLGEPEHGLACSCPRCNAEDREARKGKEHGA